MTSKKTSVRENIVPVHSCEVLQRCAPAMLFVVLGLASCLSFGQGTDATGPAAEDEADIKEITVVGSRIRRTTFDTPSPIRVITRDEATAAGFNSTAEVLQSAALTSGSSQINNAYGSYVTNGGPGANTVSLRGLGATRTLVMINGRRLAPAGTQGAVGSADLNVLPTAMIERVEVLKDGASSIYGSDAIGGVVNVITKTKVEGFTIEGGFNLPTEGEGEQTRLSLSGGGSDERWSLSGSLDIYDRANLKIGDRRWAKCPRDGLRDPETGESLDYIDPATNKPKCFPISGTGSGGVTVNTLGTQKIDDSNWAELGLNGPVVGAVGSEGTGFSRFRPNPSVTTGVVGYEGVGGGDNSLNVRDTFDPRMYSQSLISPERVYTGFMRGEYDLQTLGDGKLYVELLATRRESKQTDFRQLSMDYRLGSPLIPAELAFADFGPDQGTSDGADVGVRAFVGFGNDHSEQTVDFYKPVIGIKGDLEFLPDWKYDTYVSYSDSRGEYRTNSFLTDKITYASDAVNGPNGITCAINLTNPNEKCVAFPKLDAATLGGNLPQDFKNYVFQDVVGNTKYDETVVSAEVDGPLFTVPAGKVQGVLGVEYRRANLNDQPDPNSIADNLYYLSSASPTVGSDTVKEIYTEVEIPLLKNAPFARELTFNGSYRFTDYESYGSDNTYKLGLVYSPTSWLSLRATKGTSFRAPALFEQFQGATSGFLSSSEDPCNSYGDPGINPNRAVNCASELPGQGDYQNTTGIVAYNVGGAENGLIAETSDNLTYGIILQPDLGGLGELSVAFDYFDIKINNGVSQAGTEEILKRCYDSPGFHSAGGLCRLVARDPDTTQLVVSDAFTNLATETSRGVDLTLRYQQDVGPGSFLLDLSGTRYYDQANKIFKDDEMFDYNGTIEYPEWVSDLDLSYTLGNWRLNYGVEWISHMQGYSYAEEDPATSELDLDVGDYYKHRISLRYQAEAWEATLGVRNLFNKEPPKISALVYDRVGNAPLYSAYDYVGREVFLNLLWHL